MQVGASAEALHRPSPRRVRNAIHRGHTTAEHCCEHLRFCPDHAGPGPVVVALNNGSTANAASIPMTGIFSDGTLLSDLLSGSLYTVSSGAVQITLPPRMGALLVRGPIRNSMQAPSVAITLSPALNGNGWAKSPVTVQLRADDSGAGIESLRYWVDDGPVTVDAANRAALSLSTEGSYVVGLRAIDNAGYVSRQATQVVRIDLHPPWWRLLACGKTEPMRGGPRCWLLQPMRSQGSLPMRSFPSLRGGGGQFTATCSGAVDKAGNVSRPVSVTYIVH